MFCVEYKGNYAKERRTPMEQKIHLNGEPPNSLLTRIKQAETHLHILEEQYDSFIQGEQEWLHLAITIFEGVTHDK